MHFHQSVKTVLTVKILGVNSRLWMSYENAKKAPPLLRRGQQEKHDDRSDFCTPIIRTVKSLSHCQPYRVFLPCRWVS